MAERWWRIRWELLRVVVHIPLCLGVALLDGLRAFRRNFADSWSDRWRAGESREAWRRFGPVERKDDPDA